MYTVLKQAKRLQAEAALLLLRAEVLLYELKRANDNTAPKRENLNIDGRVIHIVQ